MSPRGAGDEGRGNRGELQYLFDYFAVVLQINSVLRFVFSDVS